MVSIPQRCIALAGLRAGCGGLRRLSRSSAAVWDRCLSGVRSSGLGRLPSDRRFRCGRLGSGRLPWSRFGCHGLGSVRPACSGVGPSGHRRVRRWSCMGSAAVPWNIQRGVCCCTPGCIGGRPTRALLSTTAQRARQDENPCQRELHPQTSPQVSASTMHRNGPFPQVAETRSKDCLRRSSAR